MHASLTDPAEGVDMHDMGDVIINYKFQVAQWLK